MPFGNDKFRGPRGPQGPRGPRGLTGPAGPPGGGGGGGGAAWYSGAGAPSGGLGVDGDFYLNETNGDVYQKASGVWGVTANIKGPAGADGADGDDGDAGAPGTPGHNGSAGPPGDAGPAGDDGITRIIRPTDRLEQATFDDRADMIAWYAADNPRNTLAVGTPYSLTTARDMGSQGGDIAPAGTVERWRNMINGRPMWNLGAAGAPLTTLNLNIKGALTAFFVIRMRSNATFQNLYAGSFGALFAYWDHTGTRYQVGQTNNTTADVGYGIWRTVFFFHYNTGSNPQARVISNDVQLYNGAAGAAGTPIPGSGGSPSAITMGLFKAGASFPFISDCAEFGFFAVDKFATIGPLRAYLRQKYATF